jgi:sialic acid synthase
MPRQITIGRTVIDDDSDCYVIAEVGHNHQGNMETARKIFAMAKECGANAVKLQKRDNKTLFTREMYESPYENRNSFGDTYGAHREFLEFGRDQYLELQAYAKELGLDFFATAFDIPSADFLADLNVPAYKLASGDLTNLPLLRHVASLGKPLILSTGGGTLEDIDLAIETILPLNSQIGLLQCTSGYPCEYEDMNLRVIESLRARFPEIVIGFSGHDTGIAMSVVAYVLGARIVEKHITLNRTMRGTDQSFSLEHGGLRRMVRDLRRARVALGDGNKRVYASERDPLKKQMKFIVAVRDLPEGHVLTHDDVAMRITRHGGLPPKRIDQIVGKRLKRPLKFEESVRSEDLC